MQNLKVTPNKANSGRYVHQRSFENHVALVLASALLLSSLSPVAWAQKQSPKDGSNGTPQPGNQKIRPVDPPVAVPNLNIVAQEAVTTTAAPILAPRWVPDKPKSVTLDPTRALAGVFVIKFAEGSHVRLTPRGLLPDYKNLRSNPAEMARLARRGLKPESLGNELADIRTLLLSYRESYGFELNAMFGLEQAKNDAQFMEKAELEQRAGKELADLDLYYIVHAKDFSDISAQLDLMNKLNKFRSIEQVYATYASETPQAVTPDIAWRQGYLDAAPSGLDGRFAWTRNGGRGDGVRVVDVEYDWVTDHEDFPSSSALFWGGRPGCPYVRGGSEHGTAVMGIIAARDNGSGVIGFASNARYGLSSVCRPADFARAAVVATFSGENFIGRSHSYVVAIAIRVAASQLSPGDVLLIEQHTQGPSTGQSCNDGNCSQWEYVPVEYYQDAYDAIERATSDGVIVVEAAGNGGQNLDMPVYSGRFDRHSGAILVGASGQGDRMAASYTSSSRRVDVFAWGSGVVTLGYGGGTDLPFNNTSTSRFYISNFSGTSSASAIIAGAVTSLQGVRRASGQLPLMPIDMRNLLVATGSPQLGSASERAAQPIGVQPNLRAAIDRMSSVAAGPLVPGLYVIRSKGSGKVLDIDVRYLRGQDNRQRLIQWDWHGGRNQVFQVIAVGDGIFEIRALHSGKALDVNGGSLENDAVIQQWDPTGGANQQFQIVSAPGGFMKIIARHSGRAFSTRGAYGNGSELRQWTSVSGSEDQLFSFTPLALAP